ncbi:phosphate/phosphite/phosphonate ABC transporter substrate-binding protein [Iodobacter sp. CM08]|uniref:phosphate/phosphite/phosphonate ABC transporter substrate-binding protein n=1 Tax=Iodobacter sp. CM08 TaxID=3085902 RepID=UPI002981C925|nr:phosphate/phosphite/phosphonate ABC transporter substrate-binding protein [Iodobacter sp. CM08]MDW5418801.1 phosphate/phosphite/phosphonate ABC transporter substrate-binding protein [Iodobacter sp. CM08]
MRKLLQGQIWVLYVGLLFAAASTFAATPFKYTFTVVPQFNPSQLHQEWTPVLQRISRETGIVLELKLVSTFSLFEEELKKGSADFAYVNPYHVVMSKSAQGYMPILRDSTPIFGILLTRRDSPFKTAHDLNEQTIAFPAANAFAASLYMRALLAEQIGIRFSTRYLSTHSNVFRHLARNEVAAAGSVSSAFNDELPELREQLQIIYKTPEVASHPLVVHPRVSAAVRDAIKQAFLDLSKDEAGRALLKEIRFPNPVLANYAKDYQPLEALKLQKYFVTESR